MKSLHKHYIGAISILLVILASGCATSPLSVYPDFNQQKKNLGTIAIVADVVVTHDVDGNIDEVLISESKKLSNDVLQDTKTHLLESGYQVSEIYVSSLGHGINMVNRTDEEDYTFLVKHDENQASSDSDITPPFYVGDKFNSSEHQKALSDTFSKIRLIEKTAESPNATHELPETLRQNINADKIMFIGSYSRRVDLSKQMGQAVLTAFLTLDTYAIHQVSYSDGALMILDTKTGEIIWSDKRYFKGGTGTADNLQSHIKQMIKNIPSVNI